MSKGKPYPKLEEEDGSGMMAGEPAVAVAEKTASLNSDSPVYKEIMSSDCRSPHTVDELIARIDYSESVEDDPNEWVSSEQVWDDVRALFPWVNIR